LAGIFFPAIGAAITQSQMTTGLAKAKTVYIALQRYELDAASTGDASDPNPTLDDLIAKGYLPASVAEQFKNYGFILHGWNASDPANSIVIEGKFRYGYVIFRKSGDGGIYKSKEEALAHFPIIK
jgi:hypothetical protein